MTDRTIEQYVILPVSEDMIPFHLDNHFSSPARRDSRVKDLCNVAQFTVGYFFDATQDIVNDAMLSGERIDMTLGSGWTVKSSDLGHVWKRVLEFSDPSDPLLGFVVVGELEMVETEKPDGEFDRNDFVKRMMEGFRIKDQLMKGNAATEDYRPENSKKIEEVRAHLFGNDAPMDRTPKAEIYKRLLSGDFVSEVFEYRPQKQYDNSALDIERGGRSITEPGDAISVTRVFSEFIHAYDPERYRTRMESHSSVAYNTLHKDVISLYSAVRGAFSHSDVFPSSPFPEMVEEIWKRGICDDIAGKLHFVTESAASLIEMGHTSHADHFDCNDGRTRAYASTDGNTTEVFVEWEDWSTLFKVRDDRIAAYKCDFATGEIGETVVDFTLDDGQVTQVNEIAPYVDLTAGVLSRALSDLSSVHCYVVTDGEEHSPASPSP